MDNSYLGLSDKDASFILNIIQAPPDKKWIRHRPIRGNASASYISGSHFIQRFNEAFTFLWSFETGETVREGKQLVVKGSWSLKIPGRTVIKEFPDGAKETTIYEGTEIRREQYGSSEIKCYAQDEYARDAKGKVLQDAEHKPLFRHRAGDIIDLGDDYKAAATDAMKKCGVSLGMFPEIYGAKEEVKEGEATSQNIENLLACAEEAGMTDKELRRWAREVLQKDLSEANQVEVVSLLPKLRKLAKETQQDV